MWRRLRRVVLGLALLAGALAVVRWLPKPPLSAAAPSSTAIYAASGELLRLTLAEDGQFRLWTPLGKIAPELIEATLLHEDRYFYLHPGVNPIALARAATTTWFGG